MNDNNTYPLDEFASFNLNEDPKTGYFTIVLKGPLKYANMLASRIGGITFSESELEEWLNVDDDKSNHNGSVSP